MRSILSNLCLTGFALTILGCTSLPTFAGEGLPTFSGPSMGTTYRVTLGKHIPQKTVGEIHRETDSLLQKIDQSLSTWRDDSIATTLNQSPPHIVLHVDHHMTNVLIIAEKLFHETEGRFDITAAPLIHWWRKRVSRDEFGSIAMHQGIPPQEVMDRVGLNHLQIHFPEDQSCQKNRSCLGNSCCASVQKTIEGVTVDFSGIGPGYAVDQIGELLLSLGSSAHLVELGGEVRAWGQPVSSNAWHVRLRLNKSQPQPMITLDDGQAVAIAALQQGKLVVHPHSGLAVTLPHDFNPQVIFAATCAEADALATARILRDFEDIESTQYLHNVD